MAILLSVSRQKAFLRRGEWTCADSIIERRLNEATEQWFRNRSATAAEKDVESLIADEMARRFNGRILLRTASNPRINGKIYFLKRQLNLEFDN
jgi:hypothetical protein